MIPSRLLRVPPRSECWAAANILTSCTIQRVSTITQQPLAFALFVSFTTISMRASERAKMLVITQTHPFSPAEDGHITSNKGIRQIDYLMAGSFFTVMQFIVSIANHVSRMCPPRTPSWAFGPFTSVMGARSRIR